MTPPQVNVARMRKRLTSARRRVVESFIDGTITAEEQKRRIAHIDAELAALPTGEGLGEGRAASAEPVDPEALGRRLREGLQELDHPYPTKAGFVYLIETLEGPHRVKVGFSEDPEDRLAGLQCGSPVRLSLRAYWPGTVRMEHALHRILLPHRVHLEWFDGAIAVVIEAVLAAGEGDES